MARAESGTGFGAGGAGPDVSQKSAMPAVWARTVPLPPCATRCTPFPWHRRFRDRITFPREGGLARAGAARPRLLTSGAMDDSEIYATIGEEGFTRLVAAFYRYVPADDILGPMYPPEDLAGAEQRLRDFLIGRFGGPMRYIEQRGHPRLRMRHAPFVIDAAARNRWVELMSRALDEVQLPREVDRLLRPFFEGVATMMINARR